MKYIYVIIWNLRSYASRHHLGEKGYIGKLGSILTIVKLCFTVTKYLPTPLFYSYYGA